MHGTMRPEQGHADNYKLIEFRLYMQKSRDPESLELQVAVMGFILVLTRRLETARGNLYHLWSAFSCRLELCRFSKLTIRKHEPISII